MSETDMWWCQDECPHARCRDARSVVRIVEGKIGDWLLRTLPHRAATAEARVVLVDELYAGAWTGLQVSEDPGQKTTSKDV